MVCISHAWTFSIQSSQTSCVKHVTPHDILKSYCPYIKNAKLILNAGILPEEGEELVASGKGQHHLHQVQLDHAPRPGKMC